MSIEKTFPPVPSKPMVFESKDWSASTSIASTHLTAHEAAEKTKNRLDAEVTHLLDKVCDRISKEASEGKYHAELSTDEGEKLSYKLQHLGYKLTPTKSFIGSSYTVSWDNA